MARRTKKGKTKAVAPKKGGDRTKGTERLSKR